jgi:sugar lactone lactonase YvrE
VRRAAGIALLIATSAGCDREPAGVCEPDRFAAGTICLVAGSGRRAYNGDGRPALETDFYLPSAVALAADGTLVVVDLNNQRLRAIASGGQAAGRVTTIAGSGVHAYASTGAPAVESPLENPVEARFREDRLLFVSLHDPRVLAVDGDGVLRVVAGSGDQGDSGATEAAATARFTELSSLAVAADGTVFVADRGAHRVRAIGPDGWVRLVAGTGTPGHAGDGGPASAAQLHEPTALAVDAAGRLYIADARNHAVRRVDTDGAIETIAGDGVAGFSGDGGPARAARLRGPEGLALAGDGSLYVSDRGNHRIRRIDAAGRIETVAGTGMAGRVGDGGVATEAALQGPARLLVGDAGLYIADQLNDCIRLLVL